MSRPLVVEVDDAGVRVERDLQVQDVVDNVLQDFHLADFLVLGDAGHQLFQLGIAVVHVVQQAHRIIHWGFAPGYSQAVLREAVFPDGSHRTERFHAGGTGRAEGSKIRARTHRQTPGAAGRLVLLSPVFMPHFLLSLLLRSCLLSVRMKAKPPVPPFILHVLALTNPACARCDWRPLVCPSGTEALLTGPNAAEERVRAFRVWSQSGQRGRVPSTAVGSKYCTESA